MTENQERAKKYLDQYRQAQNELRRLGRKLAVLREDAEGVRSSLDIPKGWTGKTTIVQCKEKGKPQQRRRVNHMVTIPTSQMDPRSREKMIDNLLDLSFEYTRQHKEAENLCMRIARKIDQVLDDPYATILKCRYLERMPYRQIAEEVCYSESYVKTLHSKALHQLGGRLKDNTK